ncbi:MAG: isoprenylcysteine carboxylmethyltransferase family protein [Acidobacteriaceae bacterium]
MSLVVRTLVYATFFIGFLLLWLPARLLNATGIHRPAHFAAVEFAGLLLGTFGALLALWCVVAFISLGKGTPAPFDAPRRLVVRGPYHFVRNPMYMGAALALAGAALVYHSLALLAYAVVFLVGFHLFVVFYEEPHLRHTFGADYSAYCAHIHRWWPSLHPGA